MKKIFGHLCCVAEALGCSQGAWTRKLLARWNYEKKMI
jgi:hypothetical protein